MLLGSRFACRLLAVFAATFSAAPAFASMGQPSPWQINFQDAATPIMEQIHSFNTFINIIIIAITLFVLALLAICVIRFSEKRNPVPSRTTHNTLLEVVWSVVPVLILVVIAIPSFRLLYAQYDFPKADLTIKVTGLQWFWKIEYQTAEAPAADPSAAAATPAQAAAPQPDFEFDVRLLPKDQVGDQPYLLAVDNVAVVPVGKVVRVQVTGGDVIHAFAVPSFGVKIDAVPGRLNETWFRADREGIYYGQCSELCGKDHAFMPIAFRVVSEPEYQTWLAQARQQFAMNPEPRTVADASAAMGR
jgi:cytochrome c oxidase subunit 2